MSLEVMKANGVGGRLFFCTRRHSKYYDSSTKLTFFFFFCFYFVGYTFFGRRCAQLHVRVVDQLWPSKVFTVNVGGFLSSNGTFTMNADNNCA